MPYLKVYEWERKTWPVFHYVTLSVDDVEKVLKRLSRHFHVPCPTLKLSGRFRTIDGKYRIGISGDYLITLRKRNINLGTTCHEFAHHLNHIVYEGFGHRGTFKISLKRVYTFAKRYLMK